MKLIFNDKLLTSRLRSFISTYWLNKEDLIDEIQWTYRLDDDDRDVNFLQFTKNWPSKRANWINKCEHEWRDREEEGREGTGSSEARVISPGKVRLSPQFGSTAQVPFAAPLEPFTFRTGRGDLYKPSGRGAVCKPICEIAVAVVMIAIKGIRKQLVGR